MRVALNRERKEVVYHFASAGSLYYPATNVSPNDLRDFDIQKMRSMERFPPVKDALLHHRGRVGAEEHFQRCRRIGASFSYVSIWMIHTYPTRRDQRRLAVSGRGHPVPTFCSTDSPPMWSAPTSTTTAWVMASAAARSRSTWLPRTNARFSSRNE